MEKGIMIKGDPGIFALEFTAPIMLMIQMSDCQLEKKEEVLVTINRHGDTGVSIYDERDLLIL